MSRYFTRAAVRALWVEDEVYREGPRHETPTVPEHVSIDTGLLTASGDRIWRAPDPIGFRFGDE